MREGLDTAAVASFRRYFGGLEEPSGGIWSRPYSLPPGCTRLAALAFAAARPGPLAGLAAAAAAEVRDREGEAVSSFALRSSLM